MKKIIMFICTMCLFSFLAVPCSAVELAEKQFPVYARCIDNSNIGFGSEVEDGSAVVEIGDAIITVSGINVGKKAKLIVMPITKETDGYSWFKGVLSKHSDKIMPFNFYFVNEKGEQITANTDFKVSITLPKGFTNPAVYFIGTDGSTVKMTSSVSDGNMSFTAKGSGYYSIVDSPKTSIEPPATGDSSSTGLVYVGVLAVLGIMAITRKRLAK